MVIRSAAIMSSRRHRVVLYLMRISLAGLAVFGISSTAVFSYVAFGPIRIVGARRVRRLH